MSWFDWLLIALWIFGVCVQVAMIGRPRTPVTPQIALMALLINGSLIAGLLITRGAFS